MNNDREEPRLGQLDGADSAPLAREDNQSGDKPRGFMPWAIGLVALLALAWFLYPDSERQPETEVEAPVTEIAPVLESLPPAPDIPVATPTPAPAQDTSLAGTDDAAAPPPPPPLPLEESDDAVREALADLGDAVMVEEALQQDDLIQRGVAFTDGAGQGFMSSKVLGISRPAGKFTTVETSRGEVIDPASFRRYDAHARAIADLDTATVVDAFHLFRPLLEQAYSQLGYKGEDFDNTVIRALDLVIATPEIEGDIAVKPKGGVYIFASPELEALPPLHKQLLRMGPDNLSLVKGQARALRAALLQQ